MLQKHHAVIAPKWLLLEEEHRHTKHLINYGVILCPLVFRATIARELRAIALTGEPYVFYHWRDCFGLICRKLAFEE